MAAGIVLAATFFLTSFDKEGVISSSVYGVLSGLFVAAAVEDILFIVAKTKEIING